MPSPLVPSPWAEDRVVLAAHRLRGSSFVNRPQGSSDERFVPAGVFQLPDEQVALFLRHLWALDGSVTINRSGCSGRIEYGSASRRLLDDVASLLRRFAIQRPDT